MRYNAVTFLAGLFRPTELLSPDDLPRERRMAYEERAAIMEFDGGLSRYEAESRAFEDILAATREAETFA